MRSALKNSGRRFPTNKITVNLAPADLKKEGAYFDLAIAVGILKATGQLDGADCGGTVFLGELALDGALRPVAGILPLLISAKALGYDTFVIPAGNAKEAAYIAGARTFAAESLSQVVDHLTGLAPLAPLAAANYVCAPPERGSDLAYVKGQAVARRALEVAGGEVGDRRRVLLERLGQDDRRDDPREDRETGSGGQPGGGCEYPPVLAEAERGGAFPR